MSDIVERLKDNDRFENPDVSWWDRSDAADEILALREQVAALTQRIRDYSDVTSGCPDVLVSRELLSKNFPALYKEMECRHQLAASQAREAKLREAIGTVCEGWTLPEGVRKTLEKALALPTDDSALQERLKQERDRCASAIEFFGAATNNNYGSECADAIRSMK